MNCNDFNLRTIDCPYTQKFGLMCSMNHCDSRHQMWCTYALKKVGDKYIYCSREDCPASKKDNPCGMGHG